MNPRVRHIRPRSPIGPWLGAFRTAALLALLVSCVPASTSDADLGTGVDVPPGDEVRVDEIHVDDANGDPRALRDLAEANEARLDASDAAETAGTVRVGPHDVVPSESSVTTTTAHGQVYDFTRGPRGKSGLELIGSAIRSGAQLCFGTGLELPDGATIAEFAAILADPDASGGTDVAEAYLQARPWFDTRTETLARVVALGRDYTETATTGQDLPVTVDTASNEYRLVTCLQGDGGFLGARIEHE